MTKECPTCGATSSYGTDEDGYPSCLRCGGPTYCERCSEPVTKWPLEGAEGFACEVCGLTYHAHCFPKGKSDMVVCEPCVEANSDPSAA